MAGIPIARFAFGMVFALSAGLGAQEGQGGEAAPGDPNRRLGAEMQDKLERWDARADDLLSEELSQAAQGQLTLLTKAWKPTEWNGSEASSGIIGAGFRGHALRPTDLVTVFEDEVLQVRRGAADTDEAGAIFDGADGFHGAVASLLAPFTEEHGFYAKLKVYRVQAEGDMLTTKAYYFAEGHDRRGRIQQKATWTCAWSLQADGPPLLTATKVEGFEEVRGPEGDAPLFRDHTESMFGTDSSYHEQLLPSMGYWQGRLVGDLGFSDQSHQGVAIGDVNGDGLEDLYLPQPGGLPNRLYLHQPDGTLLDFSKEAGVDFLDASRTALLLDFDNDGDLDLATNIGAQLVLLSNDGTGRFQVEISGRTPEVTTLAAADYDGDGYLDLYVCRYLNPYEDQAVPTPYHDANNGLDNVLLRMTEGWKVQDVTAEVGLDQNNQRFTFAASWEDFDNDGDQDLYVANDFGRNNLYRNDSGRFVDVAAEAGVEDISAGMGVSWGDYDNDGWVDLYVSNMYSSAGNRVTYQRDFRPEYSAEDRLELQRHARGNTLFRNLGDGTFQDVTLDLQVERGRWAWGSVFADLNNDGWLDLVVPNGFVTNDRDDDL